MLIDNFLNYENLRTRNGASTIDIDFILMTLENLTVREVHNICDKIENGVSKCIKIQV